MKRWLGILAMIGVMHGGNCAAQAPLLRLNLLADGNVRFGHGPELNEMQLRVKIQKLMREIPRPDIRLVGSKDTQFSRVESVLSIFKKAGYGPHFRLALISN
jgi:biopolymer transport protein ExbD